MSLDAFYDIHKEIVIVPYCYSVIASLATIAKSSDSLPCSVLLACGSLSPSVIICVHVKGLGFPYDALRPIPVGMISI